MVLSKCVEKYSVANKEKKYFQFLHYRYNFLFISYFYLVRYILL